jgi:histidinol dehydrogenase
MRILDARNGTRELRLILERRNDADPAVDARVREILERVRAEGDEALTTLTRQLDCRYIDSLGLRVARRDVETAYQNVGKDFLASLRTAKKNIERFHRHERTRTWEMRGNGVRLGQRVSPLSRVGLYIPGGKAAYPSTVLMNAVPARIAGVKEIVMVTPCTPEGKIAPEVLVAAGECGIAEIYRIGGAQAIAALAFGTESIGRVEKITGPGNAYVAAAKRMVFGVVGIDMIAGPTEVVIVADSSAPPAFVAADVIAQAEHDERATPIVLTTISSLAGRISDEVEAQLADAPRGAIARKAVENQGHIILVRSLQEALDLVNVIAPEHLELMVKNPRAAAARVTNAGSIFLGCWATEALGDYAAGPNHTLPTGGSARFSSPLGVSDFVKRSNIIDVTRAGFRRLAGPTEVLARAEGLYGHAASVVLRRGKR